ncbi:uncharacterized protein [Temnothorax longispinosus]|uniref:uncharacterized protein n=1 Tax=Temnothorax longispinosus TaxID=300112 RepID=UPI003A998AB1
MKTKVEDKKAKKRSLSETSVSIKSNQKQENINEFKKGSKKAKLAGVKQNGNPTSGEKAPILKVVDKQKKEQNKAIKQQSSIVKLSETKRDTKEKTELTVVKSMKETGDRINKRNKRRPARPYNQRDLTVEQITEKIAEIQSREVLSKRAKKLLGVLKRKLRESGNNSEKLDIVGKKSNKKAEHRENVLMQSKQKANDESKTKAEKKHIQSKGKPQEEDDDDSDIEEDDEDSDVEEESLDEESLDEEDEIMKKREIQKTVLKRLEEFKSDEDEELESEENEEEVENEEDEEEVENEEDEDEEDEENEEDDEDVEDEEDEEDQEDEEDEVQTDLLRKVYLKKLSEMRMKEGLNKNKQEQNKNKQEQNKNKQEHNKNKQEQNKNKEEDEEDEEDDEDVEDEEEEEDQEDEEDEVQTDLLRKVYLKKLSEMRMKEGLNKNKQEQNKNKQEQNKNKQEHNKNKQEQNKNKQVPQSLDNQQKGEKTKRYVLFVGNLPLNITEDEIKRHFLTKIDSITSIRIPTKPDKSPRGFAYVEVTNNIDFEKGLSLNHTFLNKRRINVQYSLPAGGKKANDATKKFMVAKNMKLQALQKAGKLAGGNQKKKPFKKENRFHIGRTAAPQIDLTAENECLRRAFEQTEEKLRKLSREKQNSQNATTAESATAKLIELSKKCRDRTAEVEALKTKCKNLEATLVIKGDELERQRTELQHILKSEVRKDCGDNIGEKDLKKKKKKNLLGKGDEERFRCLKNKLQRVQAKLCESRNTCAALRQEINKAQKLLCSEVGENVSISVLSSAPGGWRGRAEQIRNLQQKLAELQTRLSENERSQKESCDRQNLAYLRNVEKERRQQIENTAKELRQAEVALEASKRKLDASKARIKILEQELSIAKGKIAMLNEKRSHDDRLIDALNERLKISEARYQDHEMDVQNREHKIERENANIKNELRATQLHVDRLRRRLEEREIEIDKLRNGILSDESLKCRISLHPDFRLTEERQISPVVSPRSLGEPNEYVTLALAAEAERVRLLELVTLLNQRLDKERNEADALAELLRKEKSKCAKLELKLRDSEKERVGLAKVDTRYRARSCAKSMSSLRTEEETTNPDEVRYKIELLEEECLALKTRLDTVQQDKASDLAMYKRMLDQARKTFKDACRNKLATGGSRSTITI